MPHKTTFLLAAIAPAGVLLERLTGRQVRRRTGESEERVRLLQQLYREHAVETSDPCGDLVYPAAVPPQGWVNDRLSALGQAWRVQNVDGFRYEIFDVA